MTSREMFQKWFDQQWENNDDTGAWSAWQAAERQALERAAQICDENIDPAEAAFEIRALNESKK